MDILNKQFALLHSSVDVFGYLSFVSWFCIFIVIRAVIAQILPISLVVARINYSWAWPEKCVVLNHL